MKKLKFFSLILIILCGAFIFNACTTKTVALTDISLSQTETVELYTGDIVTLNINLNPVNTTETKLVISDYDTSVITVVYNQENPLQIEIKATDEIQNGINETTFEVKSETNPNIKTQCTVRVTQLPEQLATPTGLTFDGTNLVWNAITNTNGFNGYIVNINGQDMPETTDTFFPITTYGTELVCKVKALGIRSSVNSAYSFPYIFTILSAPTVLTHYNEVLNWNAVDNAEIYDVSINGGILYAGTDPTYNINLTDAGTYQISVRARSNEENVFASVFSNAITVTKLSSPQNFKFEQNKATWSSVSSATGYILTMDNDQQIILTGVNYTLPANLTVGAHQFSVVALGNGVNTLDSNPTSTISITKLSSPTNLRIENGVVTWDENPYASSYTLNINSQPIQLFENFYELSSYNAGTYNFSVTANGDGENFVTSDECATISAQKLTSPTIQVLNNVVSWNVVNNAQSYELVVNGATINTTATTYNLSQNADSGIYTFKVRAFANGYLTSNYSSTVSATKIITPTGLAVSGGILVWDSTVGVTEYELSIDNNIVSNGNKTTFALTGYNAGTYNIKIRAKGNTSSTFVSNFSSEITVTKLSAPTLSLSEGEIIYTEVENATGYLFNQNGVDTQNLIIGGDNQTMVCKIKALGDNSTFITSDYSTSLTAIQMAQTTDLSIENGILTYGAITGTVYYEITILDTVSSTSVILNNGNDLSYDLNNYAVGIYTVTIRSLGNSGTTGNLYLNNKISNSVNFERLATPINLKVTDFNTFVTNTSLANIPGQLAWSSVNSAVSYSLFVDGTEIDAGKNLKFILKDIISSGTHQIKLRANGDGISTINSDYTTEINVNKLVSPTNLRVENGSIVWDTTYNQDSLFGTTIPDAVFVIVVDGNEYLAKNTESNNVTIDNLLITSCGLDQSISSGGHTISIYTVPVNNGMTGDYAQNCLISDNSAPIIVNRVSAPTNLRMENSVIMWNKQLDASSYVLVINNDEIEIADPNTTQFSFNSSNYANYGAGNFSIKIKSITNEENCVNSAYTNNITTTVLSQNVVSVQNGILTWNSKVGVSYYELTINQTVLNVGLNTSYVLDTSYPAGSYTAVVRAIGDNSKYITSDYSNTLSAVKLATPNGLNVEGGKIAFVAESPLEDTGYFNLYVNSTTKNIGLVTLYELSSEFGAGSYEIRVQAMGDNSMYLNSDISNYIEQNPVTKLNNPSNVYLENGTLKWSAVANANGYYVNISGKDFNAGTMLSFVLADTLTDVSGNTVQLTAGTYQIKIKAIGTDGSYLNSNYTAVQNFTKLPTVNNLRVENGILTWDSLSDSVVPNKLEIHINNQTIQVENSTQYVLGNDYTAGDYAIYIVNLGDNTSYINSVKSTTVNVTKLATPTNLTVTEFKNIQFDAVENATSYKIKIVKNGVDLTPVETTDTNYSIAELESLTDGEYQFSVMAIGDNYQFANSSYSSAITITKPASPVLVATYDGSIATGKISWNSVANADGYRLIYSVTYADNTTYTTSTEGIDLGNVTTYYLSGSGNYSLKLIAYVSNMGIYSNESNELSVLFAVFDGLGTEASPYLIDSPSKFNKISYNPTAYYKLTQDISFTGVAYKQNSSLNNQFTGTIDGSNYTISNVTINSVNSTAGIVAVLGSTGTIKNLNVMANFTSGYVLGGIVGINYGTVSNCMVSGTISTNSNSNTDIIYNGGIAGKNYGTISNCLNYATVNPTNNYNLVYAGGIAGYNYGTIYQSGNNGNVTGNVAGGVVGFNETTISQSYNKGTITANALSITTIGMPAYAGGIAGYSTYTANNSINNSYNLGGIRAYTSFYDQGAYVGGIVGLNYSTINYCYTAGIIIGDNTNSTEDTNVYAGKFAGYNYGIIGTASNTKCYAINTQTSIPTTYGTGAYIVERSADNLKTDSFANALGGSIWATNNGDFVKLVWEN